MTDIPAATAPTLWDIVSAAIDDAVREVKADRRDRARWRSEIRQAAADPNAEGIEPAPLPPLALAAERAWYESDARAVAFATVRNLLPHLNAEAPR